MAATAATDTNASAAQQQVDATNAATSQILGLAAAAGSHAPPALRKLVDGLSDAELSAFRATGQVAGTSSAIVRVKGKDVRINVNGTGQAVANAHAVANAIAGVRSKDVFLNTYIDTIVRGPSASGAGSAPGLAGLLGLNGHAHGGPVTSGWATINEQGAEAVHLPNGATVLPHANTMAMLGRTQRQRPAGRCRWSWWGTRQRRSRP
jgi:hypothetical protein